MIKNLTFWLRNNPGLSVLLLLSFFIYAPSLSGGFVIDDTPFIKNNPYIRDIDHAGRFFTKGVWENSAFEITNESLYRPMNLAPMMLNYALWGDDPAGYHAFLLLLHLANILLVYVLIRKLVNGSAMAATIGAALFALHPARVESVAWISGGIDPLVSFFLLGAFLAHRAYVGDINDKKSWRYLALSLVCFQLALWSKEVAIYFPVIVVAHDLIYRRKIDWPAFFVHAIVVVAYLISRSLVLGETGKWSAVDLSQFSRTVDFLLGYSEMLLFPMHVPLYIQPPEHSVSSALGIVSAIVIAGLVWFSWRSFGMEKRKDLAFSLIWMIGFFWPALLLVLYTDGYFAGRFFYVPAAGAALFVAILYDHLDESYPNLKTAIMAASAVIVMFYSYVTWRDIPVWHDDGKIYSKIATLSPENAVGYIGLAHYQLDNRDRISAEKNFLIALEKAKTDELRVDALVALGTIYGMENELAQSESRLQQALDISPENSEAWTGLGNIAQLQGQPIKAITYYEKALTIRPGNYEALMNLAMVYDKIGQSQRGDLYRQQAFGISR